MSVSKLESLPNEILADILEKYINGVDVINAFAFQLNRRFDALIMQSQRHRFDFVRCRKDHFRVCMGLLPAYIDKVEELALGDQYTPGQVHAFLSSYPSFNSFKNLRKLYLRANTNAMQQGLLQNALCLLPISELHTLSLDISGVQDRFPLNEIIVAIFRTKTLKKLSISCDSRRMDWEQLRDISSNIEYLKMHGGICCGNLKHIFQSTPALRYINIDVLSLYYASFTRPNSSSSDALPRMPMLQNAIFHFTEANSGILELLKIYLKCMPSLQYLKLKVFDRVRDIVEYETLIQTMLPSLTSFNLEFITPNLTNEIISSALSLTGTSFWTTKQQFNLLIKHPIELRGNPFGREAANNPDQNQWNELIDQWFAGPARKVENKSSLLNAISKLYLSTSSNVFLENCYFNNVTHLAVADMNNQLLELLTNHVNCLAIKHLKILTMNVETTFISSLLSLLTNIQYLRIYYKQLFSEQFDRSREYLSIQFLDLSSEQHRFNETDISTISKMFPHLEHLIINTGDLQNVPMLQKYLPRLYSLTYSDGRLVYGYDSDYDTKMFEYRARSATKLFFERKDNWFTIWLDEAALQEPYWQMRDLTGSSRNSSRYFRDSDDDGGDDDYF